MGTTPGARISGEQRGAPSFANRSGWLKGASFSYRLWDKSLFPQIALCSGGLPCFLPHYCCTHPFSISAGGQALMLKNEGWGKKREFLHVSFRSLPTCVQPSNSLPCRFLLRKQRNKETPKTKTKRPNHQNWKSVSLLVCSPWPCHDEFSYLFFVSFISLVNSMPKLFFLSAFHLHLNVILERIWFGVFGTSHIKNTKIALLKLFFLEVDSSYITAAWCVAHFLWVLLRMTIDFHLLFYCFLANVYCHLSHWALNFFLTVFSQFNQY